MFRTVCIWLAPVLLASATPPGLESLLQQRRDVHRLPEWVVNARALEDGTWVLATLGDPEQREGVRDGIRWVRGEGLYAALDLEETPLWIDARGGAWYGRLEPRRHTTWLVRDGVSERRIDAVPEAGPFTAPPIEGRNGVVWLPAREGLYRDDGNHVTFVAGDDGQGWRLQPGFDETTLAWSFAPGRPTTNLLHFAAGEVRRVEVAPGFPLQLAVPLERGGWELHGRPGTGRIWWPPGARLPRVIRQAVRNLGHADFRVREEASRRLIRDGVLWRDRLGALAQLVADPEVRHRLEEILPAEGPAAGAAEETYTVNRELVLPRVPGPHVFVARVEEPAEKGASRRWRLIETDAAGEGIEVSGDLPPSWAPGKAMVSEDVQGFELARVDAETLAWRDAFGELCVFRNGERLRIRGLEPGNPSYPLPNASILGVVDGGLLVRLFHQVILVPAVALEQADRVPVPPRVQMTAHLKKDQQKAQNDFESFFDEEGNPGEAERMIQHLDRLLDALPAHAEGYYYRSQLRQAVQPGSVLALRDLTRFIGLGGDGLQERAWIWGELDRPLEAVRDTNHILASTHVEGYYRSSWMLGRGNDWLEAKRWASALRDLQEAVRINPDNQVARNNIAWIHATCPDEAFRDADKAVRIATEVCESQDYSEDYSIDTLAAAWAEAGDFKRAIETQEKALELIDEDESPETRHQKEWLYRRHIQLFKQRKGIRIPEPDAPLLEKTPGKPGRKPAL